ncbi:MAG: XisI protein [Armatimonadetes bacterium]|nr:XisI protein [Armatimonadota bacterium]
MDTRNHYADIIKTILSPIAKRHYDGLNVSNEAVFDDTNGHYLVMSVGWESGDVRRIHHPLVHLDIIGGKVWIQRDGTEDGVAYDLEAAGIPKSDIVLAFHPLYVRPHTGYAVT